MDEDGFVHRQTFIVGNVDDIVERDTLLLRDEVVLYVDAAYGSKAIHDKLAKFKNKDQVQR